MDFNLDRTIAVIEKTPSVLRSMLEGLPEEWIKCNEGEGTWSAFDVVGHLVHGERTDWIARIEIILSNKEERTFEPFDRFAQERDSFGKTINDLLNEFERLREANLFSLKTKNITEEDLDRKGIHPALGEVTLKNLLSTWLAHDLGHIAQINRVMAKQYKQEVGPWTEYIGILS